MSVNSIPPELAMEALAALSRRMSGFVPVGARVVGRSGSRFVLLSVESSKGHPQRFAYDRALKICQDFDEIERELDLRCM